MLKTTRGGAPIVFPTDRTPAKIAADPLADLFAAHAAGRRNEAAEAFCKVMETISKDARYGHDEPTRAEWARRVHGALGVFCDPAFEVPEPLAVPMLRCVPLIANVLAGVDTNTDSYIRTVAGQKQQAFKTSVLYSPRNTVEADFRAMLDANPVMASTWLNQAVKVMYQGNAEAAVHGHMKRILEQIDERLVPSPDLQELYFLVSYMGELEVERHVKSTLNRAIQRHLDVEIRNTPDPRKIAVFSEYWNQGHSVHRTLSAYIRALRPHFDEITLIHCVKKTDELDATGFDRVIRLETDGFRINPEPLQDNPWSVVIFPDVGMTLPSILVSNLRIAPTQMMLTGHPVSTFGGRMDWFVTGAKCDINAENYSERLAVLPGFGCIHEQPTTPVRKQKKITENILISCSAYGQKIHHEWLAFLNRAFSRCSKPITLRLFTGMAPMNNKGLAAFSETMTRALPNVHVELVSHLPYEQYLERIAECDFAIDSWPFGGSNTVSDTIHAGIPIIPAPECRADRWFAAIGQAMAHHFDSTLRITDDEFADEIVRCVESEEYRTLVNSIDSRRDISPIYDASDAPIFAQFVVDYAHDANFYSGATNEPVFLGDHK